MSLEKLIADHTAALLANAEATKAHTAALAKLGGGKPAAGGNPASGKADTGKPATVKTPTDDELRAAFGGYLSTGDASGKADRKANIQSILDHYEAKQVVDIDKAKRKAALADIETYKSGETPEWASAGDGDDGGDGDDDMLG